MVVVPQIVRALAQRFRQPALPLFLLPMITLAVWHIPLVSGERKLASCKILALSNKAINFDEEPVSLEFAIPYFEIELLHPGIVRQQVRQLVQQYHQWRDYLLFIQHEIEFCGQSLLLAPQRVSFSRLLLARSTIGSRAITACRFCQIGMVMAVIARSSVSSNNPGLIPRSLEGWVALRSVGIR